MRVLIAVLLALAAMAGFTTSVFLHHRSDSPKTPTYIEPTRVAHYPLTFVSHLKNDPQAGKKIFEEYCQSCHGKNPEIPVNAPRIGNKKEWDRFSHLDFETLFKMAAEGYGAMPARGGCFECSDQQLKQAIEYLINKSR